MQSTYNLAALQHYKRQFLFFYISSFDSHDSFGHCWISKLCYFALVSFDKCERRKCRTWKMKRDHQIYRSLSVSQLWFLALVVLFWSSIANCPLPKSIIIMWSLTFIRGKSYYKISKNLIRIALLREKSPSITLKKPWNPLKLLLNPFSIHCR